MITSRIGWIYPMGKNGYPAGSPMSSRLIGRAEEEGEAEVTHTGD